MVQSSKRGGLTPQTILALKTNIKPKENNIKTTLQTNINQEIQLNLF